jgi:hypothetical protein
MSDLELLQLSKLFWTKFMERENEMKELLLKRNSEEHQKARSIIDEIIIKLDINNCVGILFGVDVRNSLVLPERKDYIELIITPLYQRKNIKLVTALYKEYHNYLPNYWSVIKYKFWQPSHIESIAVNYKNENSTKTGYELIEITKSDIKYHPIVEQKENKLSILLFINDTKAPYLIKKEKYEMNGTIREIWIPKDYSIYAILDSAIGEYNLLNIINKMEIYLESEEKDVERHPIENIIGVVDMITNNPMSNIYKCSRCNYSNTQTKLKCCKCKNAYYCDNICQKAHRNLHKLNCISN